MQSIRVKATFNNVTRTFLFEVPAVVPANTETKVYYNMLVETITQIFTLTSEPLITYIKEDNIRQIASDQELTLACGTSHSLKLSVSDKISTLINNEQKIPTIDHVIEPTQNSSTIQDKSTEKVISKNIGSNIEKNQSKKVQLLQSKLKKVQKKHNSCKDKVQKDKLKKRLENIHSKIENQNSKSNKVHILQSRLEKVQKKYDLCNNQTQKEELKYKLEKIRIKIEESSKIFKKENLVEKMKRKEAKFNQRIDELNHKLEKFVDNEAELLKIRTKIEKVMFKKNEKLIELRKKVEKQKRKQEERKQMKRYKNHI